MWVITKIFLVFTAIFFASYANAAVIFPSVVDVSVEPGESEQIEIDVKNTESGDRSYLVEIVGVDLGTEEGDYSFYNLDEETKSWFNLNIYQFSLVSQEERVVEITFSPNQEAVSDTFVVGVQIIEESIGGDQISVRTGIMALIFITLGDEIQYNVEWIDFQNTEFIFTGNVSSYLTMKNIGQGVLQPDGIVRISDAFGRIRGESIINPELRRIPAEQVRTFLINQELPWAFGPYKVDLFVKSWPGAEVFTASQTVWLCSWKSIVLLAVLIFAIFISIRYARRH